MRYTGPKARLCRREGVNLFGSPKYQKILGKRSGIPGIHGVKRLGKLTEYAKQLREKQKARRIYGISEKQFSKYYEMAASRKGVTGDNLLQILETRVDNLVYRAGFALTRAQARQFVSHGLFTLNGRRIDVPSILVREGDVIEVRASRKGSPIFAKNIEEIGDNQQVPSWIKADPKKLKAEVTELPGALHFERLIEPQMIVEFYSR